MHRLSIAMLLLCTIFTSGCSQNQALRDSWKYSKQKYYRYINTPAQLNMDDNGDSEPHERALGAKAIAIDSLLGDLQRAMENADTNPDQEWVKSIVSSFPWLSTIAIITSNGNVEAKIPEHPLKEFNVSPLLENDPKQQILDLRAYAQMTPLGPEVYLAKPIYMSGELKGFVVVTFDPQTLVQYAGSDFSSFIMLSPNGILWNGGINPSSEFLSADWPTILKDDSSGVFEKGTPSFYWTTRYLGNMPIVYATPIIKKQPTSSPAE